MMRMMMAINEAIPPAMKDMGSRFMLKCFRSEWSEQVVDPQIDIINVDACHGVVNVVRTKECVFHDHQADWQKEQQYGYYHNPDEDGEKYVQFLVGGVKHGGCNETILVTRAAPNCLRVEDAA